MGKDDEKNRKLKEGWRHDRQIGGEASSATADGTSGSRSPAKQKDCSHEEECTVCNLQRKYPGFTFGPMLSIAESAVPSMLPPGIPPLPSLVQAAADTQFEEKVGKLIESDAFKRMPDPGVKAASRSRSSKSRTATTMGSPDKGKIGKSHRSGRSSALKKKSASESPEKDPTTTTHTVKFADEAKSSPKQKRKTGTLMSSEVPEISDTVTRQSSQPATEEQKVSSQAGSTSMPTVSDFNKSSEPPYVPAMGVDQVVVRAVKADPEEKVSSSESTRLKPSAMTWVAKTYEPSKASVDSEIAEIPASDDSGKRPRFVSLSTVLPQRPNTLLMNPASPATKHLENDVQPAAASETTETPSAVKRELVTPSPSANVERENDEWMLSPPDERALAIDGMMGLPTRTVEEAKLLTTSSLMRMRPLPIFFPKIHYEPLLEDLDYNHDEVLTTILERKVRQTGTVPLIPPIYDSPREMDVFGLQPSTNMESNVSRSDNSIVTPSMFSEKSQLVDELSVMALQPEGTSESGLQTPISPVIGDVVELDLLPGSHEQLARQKPTGVMGFTTVDSSGRSPSEVDAYSFEREVRLNTSQSQITSSRDKRTPIIYEFEAPEESITPSYTPGGLHSASYQVQSEPSPYEAQTQETPEQHSSATVPMAPQSNFSDLDVLSTNSFTISTPTMLKEAKALRSIERNYGAVSKTAITPTAQDEEATEQYQDEYTAQTDYTYFTAADSTATRIRTMSTEHGTESMRSPAFYDTAAPSAFATEQYSMQPSTFTIPEEAMEEGQGLEGLNETLDNFMEQADDRSSAYHLTRMSSLAHQFPAEQSSEFIKHLTPTGATRKTRSRIRVGMDSDVHGEPSETTGPTSTTTPRPYQMRWERVDDYGLPNSDPSKTPMFQDARQELSQGEEASIRPYTALSGLMARPGQYPGPMQWQEARSRSAVANSEDIFVSGSALNTSKAVPMEIESDIDGGVGPFRHTRSATPTVVTQFMHDSGAASTAMVNDPASLPSDTPVGVFLSPVPPSSNTPAGIPMYRTPPGATTMFNMPHYGNGTPPQSFSSTSGRTPTVFQSFQRPQQLPRGGAPGMMGVHSRDEATTWKTSSRPTPTVFQEVPTTLPPQFHGQRPNQRQAIHSFMGMPKRPAMNQQSSQDSGYTRTPTVFYENMPDQSTRQHPAIQGMLGTAPAWRAARTHFTELRTQNQPPEIMQELLERARQNAELVRNRNPAAIKGMMGLPRTAQITENTANTPPSVFNDIELQRQVESASVTAQQTFLGSTETTVRDLLFTRNQTAAQSATSQYRTAAAISQELNSLTQASFMKDTTTFDSQSGVSRTPTVFKDFSGYQRNAPGHPFLSNVHVVAYSDSESSMSPASPEQHKKVSLASERGLQLKLEVSKGSHQRTPQSRTEQVTNQSLLADIVTPRSVSEGQASRASPYSEKPLTKSTMYESAMTKSSLVPSDITRSSYFENHPGLNAFSHELPLDAQVEAMGMAPDLQAESLHSDGREETSSLVTSMPQPAIIGHMASGSMSQVSPEEKASSASRAKNDPAVGAILGFSPGISHGVADTTETAKGSQPPSFFPVGEMKVLQCVDIPSYRGQQSDAVDELIKSHQQSFNTRDIMALRDEKAHLIDPGNPGSNQTGEDKFNIVYKAASAKQSRTQPDEALSETPHSNHELRALGPPPMSLDAAKPPKVHQKQPTCCLKCMCEKLEISHDSDETDQLTVSAPARLQHAKSIASSHHQQDELLESDSKKEAVCLAECCNEAEKMKETPVDPTPPDNTAMPETTTIPTPTDMKESPSPERDHQVESNRQKERSKSATESITIIPAYLLQKNYAPENRSPHEAESSEKETSQDPVLKGVLMGNRIPGEEDLDDAPTNSLSSHSYDADVEDQDFTDPFDEDRLFMADKDDLDAPTDSMSSVSVENDEVPYPDTDSEYEEDKLLAENSVIAASSEKPHLPVDRPSPYEEEVILNVDSVPTNSLSSSINQNAKEDPYSNYKEPYPEDDEPGQNLAAEDVPTNSLASNADSFYPSRDPYENREELYPEDESVAAENVPTNSLHSTGESFRASRDPYSTYDELYPESGAPLNVSHLTTPSKQQTQEDTSIPQDMDHEELDNAVDMSAPTNSLSSGGVYHPGDDPYTNYEEIYPEDELPASTHINNVVTNSLGSGRSLPFSADSYSNYEDMYPEDPSPVASSSVLENYAPPTSFSESKADTSAVDRIDLVPGDKLSMGLGNFGSMEFQPNPIQSRSSNPDAASGGLNADVLAMQLPGMKASYIPPTEEVVQSGTITPSVHQQARHSEVLKPETFAGLIGRVDLQPPEKPAAQVASSIPEEQIDEEVSSLPLTSTSELSDSIAKKALITDEMSAEFSRPRQLVNQPSVTQKSSLYYSVASSDNGLPTTQTGPQRTFAIKEELLDEEATPSSTTMQQISPIANTAENRQSVSEYGNKGLASQSTAQQMNLKLSGSQTPEEENYEEADDDDGDEFQSTFEDARQLDEKEPRPSYIDNLKNMAKNTVGSIFESLSRKISNSKLVPNQSPESAKDEVQSETPLTIVPVAKEELPADPSVKPGMEMPSEEMPTTEAELFKRKPTDTAEKPNEQKTVDSPDMRFSSASSDPSSRKRKLPCFISPSDSPIGPAPQTAKRAKACSAPMVGEGVINAMNRENLNSADGSKPQSHIGSLIARIKSQQKTDPASSVSNASQQRTDIHSRLGRVPYSSQESSAGLASEGDGSANESPSSMATSRLLETPSDRSAVDFATPRGELEDGFFDKPDEGENAEEEISHLEANKRVFGPPSEKKQEEFHSPLLEAEKKEDESQSPSKKRDNQKSRQPLKTPEQSEEGRKSSGKQPDEQPKREEPQLKEPAEEDVSPARSSALAEKEGFLTDEGLPDPQSLSQLKDELSDPSSKQPGEAEGRETTPQKVDKDQSLSEHPEKSETDLQTPAKDQHHRSLKEEESKISSSQQPATPETFTVQSQQLEMAERYIEEPSKSLELLEEPKRPEGLLGPASAEERSKGSSRQPDAENQQPEGSMATQKTPGHFDLPEEALKDVKLSEEPPNQKEVIQTPEEKEESSPGQIAQQEFQPEVQEVIHQQISPEHPNPSNKDSLGGKSELDEIEAEKASQSIKSPAAEILQDSTDEVLHEPDEKPEDFSQHEPKEISPLAVEHDSGTDLAINPEHLNESDDPLSGLPEETRSYEELDMVTGPNLEEFRTHEPGAQTPHVDIPLIVHGSDYLMNNDDMVAADDGLSPRSSLEDHEEMLADMNNYVNAFSSILPTEGEFDGEQPEETTPDKSGTSQTAEEEGQLNAEPEFSSAQLRGYTAPPSAFLDPSVTSSSKPVTLSSDRRESDSTQIREDDHPSSHVMLPDDVESYLENSPASIRDLPKEAKMSSPESPSRTPATMKSATSVETVFKQSITSRTELDRTALSPMEPVKEAQPEEVVETPNQDYDLKSGHHNSKVCKEAFDENCILKDEARDESALDAKFLEQYNSATPHRDGLGSNLMFSHSPVKSGHLDPISEQSSRSMSTAALPPKAISTTAKSSTSTVSYYAKSVASINSQILRPMHSERTTSHSAGTAGGKDEEAKALVKKVPLIPRLCGTLADNPKYKHLFDAVEDDANKNGSPKSNIKKSGPDGISEYRERRGPITVEARPSDAEIPKINGKPVLQISRLYSEIADNYLGPVDFGFIIEDGDEDVPADVDPVSLSRNHRRTSIRWLKRPYAPDVPVEDLLAPSAAGEPGESQSAVSHPDAITGRSQTSGAVGVTGGDQAETCPIEQRRASKRKDSVNESHSASLLSKVISATSGSKAPGRSASRSKSASNKKIFDFENVPMDEKHHYRLVDVSSSKKSATHKSSHISVRSSRGTSHTRHSSRSSRGRTRSKSPSTSRHRVASSRSSKKH